MFTLFYIFKMLSQRKHNTVFDCSTFGKMSAENNHNQKKILFLANNFHVRFWLLGIQSNCHMKTKTSAEDDEGNADSTKIQWNV